MSRTLVTLVGIGGLLAAAYLGFVYRATVPALAGASSIEPPSFAPMFGVAIAVISLLLLGARRGLERGID
jgi:hypothetical protein